jgi:HD-GYP domain-containing protein (c-di-GMP phosphodiesterase class II)
LVRVVAVADAYDAITTRRDYKKPIAHEQAVERLQRDSGSHFDPAAIIEFDECREEFNSIRLEWAGTVGASHDSLCELVKIASLSRLAG